MALPSPQAGQALRPATAGNYPQINFRLSERSLVAGDAHVARERHFATAAETVSVHHGDNRFGKTIDRIEQRTIQHDFALLNRGALGKLSDVRTGDKSLVARARQHDYAHRIIRA